MNPLAAVTERDDWRVAVVLGSGMSELASTLTGATPIPYSDIDGMPVATVAGHEGALYAGEVGGVATLVFAGRAHLYEGHDAATATFAVRTAIGAGCSAVILTNAVGGLRSDLAVGSLCLIADHINLTGTNPLIGPHDGRGPRFLALNDVYDEPMRAAARSVAPELKETVFAQLTGPTYETPAEVRMLAALGADTVGMSTAIEAIAARYLGARVLAVSTVTNRAAGLAEAPPDHAEVTTAVAQITFRLESIIRGVITKI